MPDVAEPVWLFQAVVGRKNQRLHSSVCWSIIHSTHTVYGFRTVVAYGQGKKPAYYRACILL